MANHRPKHVANDKVNQRNGGFMQTTCVGRLCCIYYYLIKPLGTAVAQWLRCCAINRKVAGSIPYGFIGIFRWHIPSDGPEVDSASKRNDYQENFLGVNAAGAWGWQPYHISVPLSWNPGTLTSWKILGHSSPVTGLLYFLQKKKGSLFAWKGFVIHMPGA